jgi:hypothetical protein
MYDMDIWTKFSDYLNETEDSKSKPTSKVGLVENAPKEAIEAYEEYRRREKERVKNGEIEG